MCLNVKSGTSKPSIKDLARSYKAPDHQLISVGAGEWQQCLKDGMLALSSDSKYVKGDYLLPSVLDCFSFPCRREPLSRVPHVVSTGWWRLGTALAALDMKEEALQAFTSALQLDPR